MPSSKNRKLFGCALAALVLVSANARAGAERIVSKYTSTAEPRAIRFNRDQTDPVGSLRALFRGLGGYDLEHVGGDERSWINIRFGGKKTVDLYSATMASGGGTFPHKANDIVEWRGIEKDGLFTPFALIYRLKAGNDAAPGRWRTRLIIIKLEKEHSAVIGHAEGANESADARRIADGSRTTK
jgi:hypothetical protein